MRQIIATVSSINPVMPRNIHAGITSAKVLRTHSDTYTHSQAETRQVKLQL